jgi:ParB family chromosome partitioning protein
MKRPGGLGRGLGALIPQKRDGVGIGGTLAPHSRSFDRAEDNLISVENGEAFDQNLSDGDAHRVGVVAASSPYRELASIQERGIIEPLVVTERPGGMYELIAGERRLRAAKIAGLERVPAILRSATEQEKLEIAIIENVQRHDLNPIEEAIAYKRLMDEFGLTQDDVGTKVGKSRPQVGNTVRLLQLPEEIQHALVERQISSSNARTLLSLPTDGERMEVFRAMLAGNFTVRETEQRVYAPRHRSAFGDPNVIDVEHRLRDALGHRVNVRRGASGRGEIKIVFENDEDLQGLVEKIVVKSSV